MVCTEEVADLEDWGEVGVEHDGAKGGVLADAELEEEGGEADDGEHEEVGDPEGATPVLEMLIVSQFLCMQIFRALASKWRI